MLADVASPTRDKVEINSQVEKSGIYFWDQFESVMLQVRALWRLNLENAIMFVLEKHSRRFGLGLNIHR